MAKLFVNEVATVKHLYCDKCTNPDNTSNEMEITNNLFIENCTTEYYEYKCPNCGNIVLSTIKYPYLKTK